MFCVFLNTRQCNFNNRQRASIKLYRTKSPKGPCPSLYCARWQAHVKPSSRLPLQNPPIAINLVLKLGSNVLPDPMEHSRLPLLVDTLCEARLGHSHVNRQPVHKLPKVLETDSGSIGPYPYCGWTRFRGLRTFQSRMFMCVGMHGT